MPKIADFGVARESDLERTMEVTGTPMYMAPELLRRERYDEKVDVWSYACVLECLWTHARSPFDDVEVEWRERGSASRRRRATTARRRC